MNYRGLALDYDGTLAENGVVSPAMLAALRRWRASKCLLVLVTGRHLAPVPEKLFDAVVLENGGLLLHDGRRTQLGPSPSAEFLEALLRNGVAPLSPGCVVIATERSQAAAVRRAIEQTGAAVHLVYNNDSLMLLPEGIDKRTGLEAAAARLGLALKEILALGDAENDEPMLAACGGGIRVSRPGETLALLNETPLPCGCGSARQD